MKKHPGLWILALVWLVPSVGGGLALWAMPDAVLGTHDAGVFMSATSAPAGPFSESLTTVQASHGTFVVSGAVSATRGQRLRVVDSTKGGLQLCASGDACEPIAGDFLGAMQPNGASGFGVSNRAWTIWTNSVGTWFLIGALALVLGAGAGPQGGARHSDRSLDQERG